MHEQSTITGRGLKRLVLKNMRSRGVEGKELRRAQKIRFPLQPKILGTSLKVEKNTKRGMLTSIVYLAPSTESLAYGGRNLCPMASQGCSAA